MIQMLENQVHAADSERDALSKQNNKLLVSKNPQAKTQYLDNVRQQLNESRKEVLKL